MAAPGACADWDRAFADVIDASFVLQGKWEHLGTCTRAVYPSYAALKAAMPTIREKIVPRLRDDQKAILVSTLPLTPSDSRFRAATQRLVSNNLAKVLRCAFPAEYAADVDLRARERAAKRKVVEVRCVRLAALCPPMCSHAPFAG